MTQHSQNGEGAEVKPARYVEVDKGVFVAEDDYRGNGAEIRQSLTAREPATADVGREQAVKVCPQCEGEGGYPDGVDEAACHTVCTRCGSNGWIVDLAALSRVAPSSEPFGYWIEQKHAEPALLRKPAYIPEPSDLRTVTPLYAAPSSGHAMAEGERGVSGVLLPPGSVDDPAYMEGWLDGQAYLLLNRPELATTPPTTNDAIPAGMGDIRCLTCGADVALTPASMRCDCRLIPWSATTKPSPTPKGGLPGRGEVERLLSEARKLRAITIVTMECNSDDVRTADAIIQFLETYA